MTEPAVIKASVNTMNNQRKGVYEFSLTASRTETTVIKVTINTVNNQKLKKQTNKRTSIYEFNLTASIILLT